MKKVRVFADTIDLFLFVIVTIIIAPQMSGFLASSFASPYDVITQLLFFLFSSIFCLASLDSFFNCLFFTSPGKWLYNIKITTRYNVFPSRKKMLFRSVLKTISLITFFGAIITVIAINENGNSWYDDVLALKLVVVS